MKTPLNFNILNPNGTAETDPVKKQRLRNFMTMLMSAMITYTLRVNQLKVDPILNDVYAYFPVIDDEDDLDLKSFKEWLQQQQQREQLQQFLDRFKAYLNTLDDGCEKALSRLADAAQNDPDIAHTQTTLETAIRDLYSPLTAVQLAQMLVGRPSANTLNQGVHPALQADVRDAHQEFVWATANSAAKKPAQSATHHNAAHANYKPQKAPTTAVPTHTHDDVHEAFASYMERHMAAAHNHHQAGNFADAVYACALARAYRTFGIHFNRSRNTYDEAMIGRVASSCFIESESSVYAAMAVQMSGLAELMSFANGNSQRSSMVSSFKCTVYGGTAADRELDYSNPFISLKV